MIYRRGVRSIVSPAAFSVAAALLGLTLLAGGCGSGSTATQGGAQEPEGSQATPQPSAVTASSSPAAPGIQLAWPSAYRDVDLDGRALAAGPAKKHIAWKAKLGRQTKSWAVLDAEGRVVVGVKGAVVCYDPQSGAEVWTYAAGADCTRWPAARPDGSIIVSAGKKVRCLDAGGTELWSRDLDVTADSPTVAPDGTIYVGSLEGTLTALSPGGDPLWTYEAPGSIRSPSIGADGMLYCGAVTLVLYAFSPDGSLLWQARPEGDLPIYKDQFPWSNCLQSPSIGDDGTLYAGSQVFPAMTGSGKKIDDYQVPESGSLYAITPEGKRLWEYTCGSYATMTPTIAADGTLYAGTSCFKLVALGPQGQVDWEFVTPQDDCPFVFSPPIGTDGLLYTATSSGKLYCVTPRGKEQWRYEHDTAWLPDHSSNNLTPPAVAADGRLFTTLYDGTVLAFD
jgi:outer membrane protein assembly factor BamB